MITVPALMLLGLPANYANATNRLAILPQSISGVIGFNQADQLDRKAIIPMLAPTILGAVFGALLASNLPADTLKPILLGTMIAMAVAMLIAPNMVAPPEGTIPYPLMMRPSGVIFLFGAGVYGGFAQAGVGFILIAVLSMCLRYDLVRTNALKAVCTALFSFASLVVFIASGHVDWKYGILLAIGTTIGAVVSVKFAINVSQRVIKWTLFVVVCITSGSAFVWG